MDKKQLWHDIITFNTKSFRLRLYKLDAVIKRIIFLPFRRNFRDGKDIRKIPIIINNFNRYSYLLLLIKWLEKNSYTNIYIIDNASTYPKLLDYYSEIKYPVFKLKYNIGHLALWKSGIIKHFEKDYYVYTDPDILPIEDCPDDVIAYFMKILNKYKAIEKVGFALKIDDIPECYGYKQKVIEWEKGYWKYPIEENVYEAAIDTTFALYRPYTNGGIWVQAAYRIGGKYKARHLPWYEDTKNPTEENLYYKKHATDGISHW